MLDKIKTIVITVFVTLGVLFVIILLMPDDEEKPEVATNAETTTISESEDVPLSSSVSDTENFADLNSDNNAEVSKASGVESTDSQAAQEAQSDATAQETANEAAQETANSNGGGNNNGNVATINLPESEISSKAISFQTVSLDNEAVTQDIFADYDLTIVHVWGTYCSPCIAEMGDYGNLYSNLPDNVNLIGIVCDVYDGINNNVSDAHQILNNSNADFMNLRVSDDIYSVISNIQLVPTSFFVDRQGHMVGSMLEGESFEKTKEKMDSYLQ